MGISIECEGTNMENKSAFNEEISRTSPTCTIDSNDDRKFEVNVLETGGGESAIETIVILKGADETQQNIKEPQPIPRNDDEAEEGEIVNSDDNAGAFEYESISSDEEFVLRQKIEALEARNLELEKIASISSRSIDYDANYGQSSPANSSHKTAPITDHRSNLIRLKPPLPDKRSNHKFPPKPNIEIISSEDERIESTRGTSNDNNKGYGRKKRRTRDKKMPNSLAADSESRCSQHGRRYCISCNPSELALRHRKEKRQNQRHDERNAKPRKNNYPSQSDDDDVFRMLSMYDEKQSEEELVRNREILRMALNFYDKNEKTISKSTLSHKLAALDDVDLQTSSGSRKRRNSLSDDVLLETSNRKVRHSKESESKPKKDIDGKMRKKVRIDKSRENGDANDIDIYDDTMSLEEQELRLIALKSAVLKKHEQRKKKQQADNVPAVRPYSPTDSVIMAEEMEQSNDCNDSDNNNMDISPISSPEWQNDDMELVTSNDDSKSPVFTFADKSAEFQQPTFVDWQTFAMPMQMDTTFLKPIPTTCPVRQSVPLLAKSQPFSVPHSTNGNNFEAESKNEIIIDNEHELRAQLIVQLRNHSPSQALPNDSIEIVTNPENNQNEQRPTTADDAIKLHDDSLEEDCLRSLLLSTKGKKLRDTNKEMLPQPNAIEMAMISNCTTDSIRKSDDMPEVMSNLRGALKRLRAQGKQPTADDMSCNMPHDTNGHLIDGDSIEVDEPTPILDQQTVTITKLCDDDEKTVDNNELDSSASDFCATKTVHEKQATSQNIIGATTLATQCSSVNVGADEIQAPVIKSNELTAPGRNVELKDAKKQTQPAQQKQQPTTAVKLIAKSFALAKKASAMAIIATKALPTGSIKDPTADKLLATANAKTISIASHSIAKSIETKIMANKSTIVPIALAKADMLRKSTASPVIPGWTARPVKKVIIRPFEDSSTDEDFSDATVATKRVPEETGTKADDREFEQSLDKFLNTVRANVSSEKTNTIPITKPQQASASKATADKPVAASSTVKSTTVESSKSVRHLPLSSQLEYHRLIKRMQLLEKQREQKSQITPHASKPAAPSKQTEQDLPKITITLRNESRFVRTDQETTTATSLVENSAIKSTGIIKTTNDVASAPKTSETMIRLSKSTIQSTNVATNSESKAPNVPAKPSSNRPTVAASPEKKTKTKAAVLDSYVNQYNGQSEQWLGNLHKMHLMLSRSNLELKKQQKFEQELNEIRQKMKQCEHKLAYQQEFLSKLQPAIVAAERRVSADRAMFIKLRTCCNRLGAHVKGPSYKVTCVKMPDINAKLKTIAVEKSKAALLKKSVLGALQSPAKKLDAPKISTNSTVASSVKSKIVEIAKKEEIIGSTASTVDIVPIVPSISTFPASSTSSTHLAHTIPAIPSTVSSTSAISAISTTRATSPMPSMQAIVPASSSTSMDVDIERSITAETTLPPVISLASQSSDVPAGEESEIDLSLDCAETTKNMKIVQNSIEKIPPIALVELNTPITAGITQSDNSPTSTAITVSTVSGRQSDHGVSCGKYDSPLHHLPAEESLQDESVSNEQGAILCPFDLMGRCLDVHCAYQHLSS